MLRSHAWHEEKSKTMSDAWYFIVGASRMGPISYEALVAKIKEAPDSIQLVWTKGMADWAHARALRTFEDLFVHAPPPLPASGQNLMPLPLMSPPPIAPLSVLPAYVPPHAGSLQGKSLHAESARYMLRSLLPRDVPEENPAAASSSADCPRWRRCLARMLDTWLFGGGAVFATAMAISASKSPQAFPDYDGYLFLLGWIMTALYIPFEALLLVVFGTTLGKYCHGVVLTPNGPFDYRRALRRSLLVWWRGTGAGFPLAALITLPAAYFNLAKRGTTSWDRDCDCTMSYTHATWPRYFARNIAWALVVITFNFCFLSMTGVGYESR
jgi:hypothetical protein